MKHGQEKSDLFVVAKKPANKPGRLGAELVEPRKRTKGNMVEQHTCRTLRRASVTPRLNCVRQSCSRASSLITQGGSPVREIRPPGSVPGVPSNGHSYRDKVSNSEGIANQTGAENVSTAVRLFETYLNIGHIATEIRCVSYCPKLNSFEDPI
jgi:hypothetical protein